MSKFNPMDILGGVIGGMNPAGAIVGAIVGQVLNRGDVPMHNADVPATARKVAQAVADAVRSDKIAVVPVKSGWASKINWTQVAGPGASTIAVLLGFFGLNLTADQIATRKAAWVQPAPRYTRGVLAKYAKLVSTASEGAVTDKYL